MTRMSSSLGALVVLRLSSSLWVSLEELDQSLLSLRRAERIELTRASLLETRSSRQLTRAQCSAGARLLGAHSHELSQSTFEHSNTELLTKELRDPSIRAQPELTGKSAALEAKAAVSLRSSESIPAVGDYHPSRVSPAAIKVTGVQFQLQFLGYITSLGGMGASPAMLHKAQTPKRAPAGPARSLLDMRDRTSWGYSENYDGLQYLHENVASLPRLDQDLEYGDIAVLYHSVSTYDVVRPAGGSNGDKPSAYNEADTALSMNLYGAALVSKYGSKGV
ncbi:hypothetical protein C8Q80DRAFT_1124592 [Daedaleopsis nitida]|nr:hypothetical protein C8Q80DRAFT_1124592 [Daedaleopsis nitida]